MTLDCDDEWICMVTGTEVSAAAMTALHTVKFMLCDVCLPIWMYETRSGVITLVLEQHKEYKCGMIYLVVRIVKKAYGQNNLILLRVGKVATVRR